MSQEYGEGDWFSVPLGHQQAVIGLVARRPKRGSLLLGYFFGLPRPDLPPLAELQRLKASDAVLVCRVKDSALHRGFWRVIAGGKQWRHEDWPMPSFLRREGLSGRAIRVDYDNDNLTTPAREVEATAADMSLPEDIVLDEKRIVETLSRLFASQKLVSVDPGQWNR